MLGGCALLVRGGIEVLMVRDEEVGEGRKVDGGNIHIKCKFDLPTNAGAAGSFYSLETGGCMGSFAVDLSCSCNTWARPLIVQAIVNEHIFPEQTVSLFVCTGNSSPGRFHGCPAPTLPSYMTSPSRAPPSPVLP